MSEKQWNVFSEKTDFRSSFVVKRLEQESSSRVKTSIDHSKEKTKKKFNKKSTSIEEHSKQKQQVEEQNSINDESIQTISLPGFNHNQHSALEHRLVLFSRSSPFVVIVLDVDRQSILPSVLLPDVRLISPSPLIDLLSLQDVSSSERQSLFVHEIKRNRSNDRSSCSILSSMVKEIFVRDEQHLLIEITLLCRYSNEDDQWAILLQRQEEYYQAKLGGLRSILISTYSALKNVRRHSFLFSSPLLHSSFRSLKL